MYGEKRSDFAGDPSLPRLILVAGTGNLLVKSLIDESSL
jgi:hypothetical protein